MSEVIREFYTQTKVNGTSQLPIHTHLIVAHKIQNARFSQGPLPVGQIHFRVHQTSYKTLPSLPTSLTSFFGVQFSVPITSKRTDITGHDLQCWEEQQE